MVENLVRRLFGRAPVEDPWLDTLLAQKGARLTARIKAGVAREEAARVAAADRARDAAIVAERERRAAAMARPASPFKRSVR